MSKIRIFSLGGLNEDGKNMYIVDVDNDIYVFGDNENDYVMLSNYESYYIGDVEDKIKDVCIKGYNEVYEFFEDEKRPK